MFCMRCGQELDDSARFCMACGAQQMPGSYLPAGTGPVADQTENTGKKRSHSSLLIIVPVIAILAIAGVAGTYFYVNSDSYQIKRNQDEDAREILEELQPQTPEVESQPQTPEVESQPQTPEVESQPQTPEVESQPQTPEAESQPQTPEAESRPQTPEVESQPQNPESEPQLQNPAVESQLDTQIWEDYVTAFDGYAEGVVGTVFRTVFFDYRVDSVAFPSEYEGYIADDGMQLVDVKITIRNTFGEELPMYNCDFQIQWHDLGDGDEDFDFGIEMDDSDTVMPFDYSLADEATCCYHIIYEVPAEAEEFSISFQEFFSDNTEGDVFFTYFNKSGRDFRELSCFNDVVGNTRDARK
ncbi:MAG: zinc-ribbon domain-containing protein [bacterium]|nr:zinc-ribbon domain-containing protein [bacterium]